MMPEIIHNCRTFDFIFEPLNDGRGPFIHRSDIDDFRIHLLQCGACRQKLNQQALDFLFDGVSEELRRYFGVI